MKECGAVMMYQQISLGKFYANFALCSDLASTEPALPNPEGVDE